MGKCNCNEDTIKLLKECDAGSKMAVTSIDEVLDDDNLNEAIFNTIHIGNDEEDLNEFEGVKILAGRNNIQNDRLTLKIAKKNYMWLHTKNIHGSHVILKTNENEITQELINKCASIAAFYSKAKDSSNVAVDYTYVKYVKKPAGAKPGMVIYTNYTTVNVHPNNFEI